MFHQHFEGGAKDPVPACSWVKILKPRPLAVRLGNEALQTEEQYKQGLFEQYLIPGPKNLKTVTNCYQRLQSTFA